MPAKDTQKVDGAKLLKKLTAGFRDQADQARRKGRVRPHPARRPHSRDGVRQG
jgi:hypothetical protein